MNFCANSARLLRKLDHVLLWILSNDTRLLQCNLCAEQRKFQRLAMFCLYTLPLARPAQAKIQMLRAIWSIVKLIPWNKVNLSHLYFKKHFKPCLFIQRHFAALYIRELENWRIGEFDFFMSRTGQNSWYLLFTKDKISVPACLLVVNTLIYDFGQNKLSSTHSSRHWLQTFFRVKRREVLSSGPGLIKILLTKSLGMAFLWNRIWGFG